MKRREFITLFAGSAAAWPLAARAQQSKGPARLGFLPIGSPRNTYDRSLVEAFQQGLRQVGLIENRNIVLDVVWVGDDPDQAVSEELQRGAELLITSGSSVSVAARRQTSTIPIVFLHVGDPTAMGLIESLSRPGRNATGFSDILADLSGKFVDLATELTKPQTTIDMPDTFTTVHRAKIATLTAQYRLPAVYPFHFFATSGGLLSYGSDTVDSYRRAAPHANRILRGEKPSELPLQAPVKYELVVNLKTAKALGLEVPALLEQRADEVIE